MKKLLAVLISLIFIAPVMAQGSPPSSLLVLDGGFYDSYELLISGLMVHQAIGGTFTTVSASAFIGGNGSYITNAGDYAYIKFRGTGFVWMSSFNGATGDICINGSCVFVTAPNIPGSLGAIYTVTGLSYGTYDIAWKRWSGAFYIDGIYIVGGDLPTATPHATSTPAFTATPYTPVPTATAITVYPTPTPMELGTAISEVIAEMTVEVTVILPESTAEPYGVPMTIEGTTGTQDGLFEYKATAGDSLIMLGLVILIVIVIAQLGVMLWKR